MPSQAYRQMILYGRYPRLPLGYHQKIIRDPRKVAQIFSEMPLAPTNTHAEPEVENNSSPTITNHKQELIKLLNYHLDLFDRYQPTLDRPFETLKRFFKIYIRGFDGAKELREQLMNTKSTDEVRQLINSN